jgi:hypothetical protein
LDLRSVLLLSTVWPARALLRAQLIESGLEVVATDSWADAREQMLRRGPPHLFILDLQELQEPASTLRELGTIMPPACVLVLGALATAARDAPLHFQVLPRPFSVGAVVETVEHMLQVLQPQAAVQPGGPDA